MRRACVFAVVLVVGCGRGNSHLKQGLAALEAKDFDLAVTCLNDAVKDRPDDPEAYVARGSACIGKKEYDKAVADFTEAIRLKPDSGTYKRRAATYVLRGESDKAIADYDRALQLNPKDAKAFMGRGRAHLVFGTTRDALADLTEAISLDPKLWEAYESRGSVYSIRLEEYQKAVADYTVVIKNQPSGAAHFARARCYYNLKMLKEGSADLDAAERLDPSLWLQVYDYREHQQRLEELQRGLKK